MLHLLKIFIFKRVKEIWSSTKAKDQLENLKLTTTTYKDWLWKTKNHQLLAKDQLQLWMINISDLPTDHLININLDSTCPQIKQIWRYLISLTKTCVLLFRHSMIQIHFLRIKIKSRCYHRKVSYYRRVGLIIKMRGLQ